MDSNKDNIREARLGRAVRRVWEKLLRSMKSEPSILVRVHSGEVNKTSGRDWR